MANISTKQKWIRTGRTFSAPEHLCDYEIFLSKHEREIIIDLWEMDDEIDPAHNWERGTWATLERQILRRPRKGDLVWS